MQRKKVRKKDDLPPKFLFSSLDFIRRLIYKLLEQEGIQREGNIIGGAFRHSSAGGGGHLGGTHLPPRTKMKKFFF